MFCEDCGGRVSVGDRVCSACGVEVESEGTRAITVPPYQEAGSGVLGATRTVLRALSEGKIIRRSIAVALQVVAALVLLGGLLTLIQILKFSFQSSSATATIGGLVLAIVMGAAVFGVAQILLFRAQSILNMEDSPFTVIPILSILFRVAGETYALVSFGLGVGGCLFIWLSGLSPLTVLSGLGLVIPSLPPGGESFLDGLIFIATLAAAGFIALVVFYALAELVVVMVDIAVNVRRMANGGVPASS